METFPTTYEIVKDCLLLLFAGIGSITAFIGLSIWRKQLKGKTEYELSRRILLSVYKIREGIKRIRKPIFDYEVVKAKTKLAESIHNESTKLTSDRLLVLNYRLKPLFELISLLKVDLLEAEVVFGNIIQPETHLLFALIGELITNLYVYEDTISRTVKGEKDVESLKKYELLIHDHSTFDNEDEYSKKISNVISSFEQKLKIYFK